MRTSEGFVQSRFAQSSRRRRGQHIEQLEGRTLFAVGVLPAAFVNLNTTTGADAADGANNVVYVADNGHDQILAVDTNAGDITSFASANAPIAGLAVSADDTELYATEPTALQVQIFSLADGSLQATLPIATPLNQITALANGRFAANVNGITIFDATTGNQLFNIPGAANLLLESTPDGTTLYSRPVGASGAGTVVKEFDASGLGAPVALSDIPAPAGTGSTDYAVAPNDGFAYLGDAGAAGVEETTLAGGALTTFAGGATNNIASFDGTATVDAITTATPTAQQFDTTGTLQNQATLTVAPLPETLLMTSNGNAAYTTGTGVGILGLSTLTVNTTPQLEFVTEPSNTVSGSAFSPVVKVEVVNFAGAVVSSFNGFVTLSDLTGNGVLNFNNFAQAVNGIATFTGLTITGSGGNTLQATDDVNDIPVNSNPFNVIPPKLVFIQQPTEVKPGATLAPAVRIAIEDGNTGALRTTDQSIVTLNISNGPGNLNGTTTVSAQAVNGIATFSNLVLGANSGTVTLTATDNADTPGNSAGITISPAAGTNHLVFVQEPSKVTPGAVMSPAVTVDIANFAGSVVNSNAVVTLSANSGPGTLAGIDSVAAVNGVATFNDLIVPTAGFYTLSASSNNGSAAISSQFLVGRRLMFVQLPASTIAGQRIGPSVIVESLDQNNNLVTSDNSSVTVALASGPSSTLHGTTTVPLVNGIADFKTLAINTAGSYTFTATDNGSIITSNSFTVRPGAASQLAFLSQPQSTAVGATISPVIVAVEDRFGNVVTTAKTPIRLAIGFGPAGRSRLHGTTRIKPLDGLASFDTLSLGAGAYKLKATSGKIPFGLSNIFVIGSLSGALVKLLK